MDRQESESTSARWQGWCDGSAVPNPGRMGIGGLLRGPQGEELVFSVAMGRTGCNNEAEALALRGLLEHALAHGIRHLQVWSDSDVAVRLSLDAYSKEAQRLSSLFADIRILMGHFEQIELRWLPQHRNLSADRLSRQALGLKERPPVSPRPSRRRH
ncbi:ribonuclease HI family protein [Uliginosibacterium gangwonense]|uniref:ribonuclease HI family protein n=1 Tax=Uliginosibacterium gangwonense TaxID=392736 RepID=UPI0004779BC8|nr:ribonuclease HI family protein [Uliginosibacterium gangwonense]